jgi:hypothetical protein
MVRTKKKKIESNGKHHRNQSTQVNEKRRERDRVISKKVADAQKKRWNKKSEEYEHPPSGCSQILLFEERLHFFIER